MISKGKIAFFFLLAVGSVHTSSFAANAEFVTAERLIAVLAPGLLPDNSRGQDAAAEFSRGIGGIRTGFADPAESDQESDASAPASGGTLRESLEGASQNSSRIAFDSLFEADSYNLKADAYRQLDEIGRALHVIMSNDPAATFTIAGYSIGAGSANNNKTLSERMAVAVANYLVGKLWLDDRRLTVVGRGPGASNVPGGGTSSDSRVEILAN